MKKICLIFTGGTIGSSARQGVIDVSDVVPQMLLDAYAARADKLSVMFDIKRPFTILSERISAQHLLRLRAEIKACADGRCDGIIITHGTDTLGYTANFLGLCLGGVKVPVLLVSSCYPLEHPKSNGLDIFAAAVRAVYAVPCGVYAVCKNEGELVKIHLAQKLMQARCDGYFESNGGAPCEGGAPPVGGAVFTLADGASREDSGFIPTGAPLTVCKGISFADNVCLKTDILCIRAHAMQDFRLYNIEKDKPRAVVVELYHSGTADTAAAHGLAAFCDSCAASGVTVVLAPIGEGLYAGMKEVLAKGNVLAADCGIEAAFMRTVIAFGTFSGARAAKFIKTGT